jgi:Heme exporter protein D (CcmD)
MPNPVDTDYSAYVIWAYAIGATGLGGVLAWTVIRLTVAKRKLEQAEKDDTP